MIDHGRAMAASPGGGEAMSEECAVDPASGQPLAGSFLDYGMPRSDNLPSFPVEIVEILSQTNPSASRPAAKAAASRPWQS